MCLFCEDPETDLGSPLKVSRRIRSFPVPVRKILTNKQVLDLLDEVFEESPENEVLVSANAVRQVRSFLMNRGENAEDKDWEYMLSLLPEPE